MGPPEARAWLRAAFLTAVVSLPGAAFAKGTGPGAVRVVVGERVPSADRAALRATGAVLVVRPFVSSLHRGPFLARVARNADVVELPLPLSTPVVSAVREVPVGACRLQLVGERFSDADRSQLDKLGPCRVSLVLVGFDAASIDRWPSDRGPLRVVVADPPPMDVVAARADGRWTLLLPLRDLALVRGAATGGSLRFGVVLGGGSSGGVEGALDGVSSAWSEGPPDPAIARRLRALGVEQEWRLGDKPAAGTVERLRDALAGPDPTRFRAPSEGQLDAPLKHLPDP